MRAVPLRIEIMSPEEAFASEGRIIQEQLRKARAGEKVAPYRRLVFHSLEDLRSFLTPARLELLRHIRRAKPDSIYALARHVSRDRKAVMADLDILVHLGLVTMTKSRGPGRGRTVPHVPYSRIEIGVEV